LNITKYKEREQEQDLDLKTKMLKYMVNASFYRLKFGTIDLITNYWVGGHLLTWWLAIDLLVGQNIIANIRIWTNNLHEISVELNQYLFSKLSPFFVFSILIVKQINQSFELWNMPTFKMSIYHKLKISYIIKLVIIKHT
jgi:hypothetical protein